MADLTHHDASSTAPPERRRPGYVTWLALGLGVALLAVVALGAWVYVDHRETTAQQRATAAVTAFMEAKSTGDPAAVAATTTTDVVMTGLADGRIDEGPYRGTEFTTTFTQTLGPSFRISASGPATMAGTDVIAVPSHVTDPAFGYDRTGVAVYRLTDVDGALKIAEIVWLPWSSS